MAAPIEERLERLESRVEELESARSESFRLPWSVTVEEVRARRDIPAEYDEETRRLMQEFLGCFEGPEDLSQNFREYLRGERSWPLPVRAAE